MTTLETTLNVGDLFDSLGEENEQPEERKIEVRKDQKLISLLDSFERHLAADIRGPLLIEENEYRAASELFRKFQPVSPHDIGRFVLGMKQYEDSDGFDMRAGRFLSGLINESPFDNFSITTSHFQNPLGGIGYRNVKSIHIRQDAGPLLGDLMSKGGITLEGNAGSYLGLCMSGGKIVVNGDCGPHAGTDMENGVLVINGNIGPYFANRMKGGEIHINGEKPPGAYTYNFGGRIYHKGKLIAKDGRRIK